MVTIIQSSYRHDLLRAITGVYIKNQIVVNSINEYKDISNDVFLLRIESVQYEQVQKLEKELKRIIPEGAIIKINPQPEKKVVILVTREYHCLADILIRNEFKTLGASIECVIGNYPVLAGLCEKFGVPFHCISHEAKDKPAFEAGILNTIKQYKADYLVLAKFMRILSPDFF